MIQIIRDHGVSGCFGTSLALLNSSSIPHRPTPDTLASTDGSAGDLEIFRRRTTSQGIHALWRLRTPEPGTVALERRHMGLPFRGAQSLWTATPGAATDHFGNARCRSCRVAQRGGAVIVIVIPVAHPLPDIPGHIIDAIGALAISKHTHRC